MPYVNTRDIKAKGFAYEPMARGCFKSIHGGVCVYFQNLDNFPLDHRQIQLDSEAIQKLMLTQLVDSSSAASPTTTMGQGEISTTRSKSPLSQAMLQIHSPNSVPDVNMGETVVLQMEDGKATLQMEEGKATLISHASNGRGGKSERDNNNKSANLNKDGDYVLMKKGDKIKADSLQAVLTNLITAHTGNINKEQDLHAKLAEARLPVKNGKRGSPTSIAPKSTQPATILIPPTVFSNGGRKGSMGDVSPGGSSSGSPTSLSSPGAVQVPLERKRSKVKAPHPAFNIQQMGTGLLYNYNLPDRGLGSMTSPTVSPPAVTVPRFPVSVSQAMASQVLNFVSAGTGWPGIRPMSHSSNSNDSQNSSSPLDLSSVRDAGTGSGMMGKGKTEPKVSINATVSLLQKPASRENMISSPSQSPKSTSPKSTNTGNQTAAAKKSPEDGSPPAKPPYTQEMLYLFNKELEIVSVGKNKWIIRNENELVDLIKKNAIKSTSCDEMKSPTEKGVSLGKRINSLPLDDDQGSKVMKLTNGDVHTEDNSQSNSSTLKQIKSSENGS